MTFLWTHEGPSLEFVLLVLQCLSLNTNTLLGSVPLLTAVCKHLMVRRLVNYEDPFEGSVLDSIHHA